MPREAKLFEITGGSVLRAYILMANEGGNVPPMWIERAQNARKNREKAAAKALQSGKVTDIAMLEDWELAYRKECFYRGIRCLMEMKRKGKTRL